MPNRRLLACVLTSFLLLPPACGGATENSGLKPFLCRPADLADAYQPLTEGDFTAADFAGFGAEPPPAGFRSGRFALFKEALAHPPFEPQINVVCAALRFENSAEATDYLQQRSADPGSLTPLLVGQEAAVVGVREQPLQGTGASKDRARFFLLDLADGGVIALRLGVSGDVARAVAAGGPGVSQKRATSADAGAAACEGSGVEGRAPAC